MPQISKLYSHEILDSRSTPTIEVICVLDDGNYGVASVPSGSSTGSYESLELRDGDNSRYLGKGVLKAVANVNQTIASLVVGKTFNHPDEIDHLMITADGTANKSKLGSNAILGVSIAVTKAFALSYQTPLYRYIARLLDNHNPLFIPIPVFNMINGGKHGAGNLDFQEFHVIPAKSNSFSNQLQMGSVIYQTIKKFLQRRGAIHSVGDEGGFAPNLFTNLDALEILSESIKECGYRMPLDVSLGLDVAANSFYTDGRYTIKDRSSHLTASDFIEYFRDLNNQYLLLLLEDPLAEDDWKNWSVLCSQMSNATTIVGDDLLVTNPQKLKQAIAEKACNAAIIKPHQIGTITETLEVIQLAKNAGFKINVSHRSGETNDTFIADFAVGVGADYAKFGAPARGERICKYNRFLSIEAELSQSPI